MNYPIRVAVVGGGIAGVITANALNKISHIDVHVYESAPEFSERGQGVGLSQLALQALDDIIPSATELLKTQAGAVPIGASRLVIVRATFLSPTSNIQSTNLHIIGLRH